MATYKHTVKGRVNRRYGVALREETRDIPESPIAYMETLTSDVSAVSHMTFGRASHKRGNSAGA